MPSVIASQFSTVALAKLKPDLEAEGEHELAVLELSALLGIPENHIRRLKHGIIELGMINSAQAALLQSRLAFADEIVFNGQKLACLQAQLERAYGGLSSIENGNGISARSRRRNEYLSHGFHKYKAKFFPRMARALINIVCGVHGSRVLDPFVGSGTMLIEAYMMGLHATGVDLDPLSVFISTEKVNSLFNATHQPQLTSRLLQFANSVPSGSHQTSLFQKFGEARHYHLPEYIRVKIDGEIATKIEREVALLRGFVETFHESSLRALGLLALSHSIATKLNLRWMGTGDNRFSLTVRRMSLLALFQRHLRFMAHSLDTITSRLIPNGAVVEALEGNALDLPFASATFDGIVTSPPYIPASSGRETYLRSRGPSLLALEFFNEKQLFEREARMMGSVLNQAAQEISLPSEIVDLVEWMRPQRARGPKAEATATYFAELHKSLGEMARVLKPGGRLALVLSSAHVFYDLVSRKVVRVLDMANTVEKLLTVAPPIPLRLTRTIRMNLAKMNFTARPGARGEYSEAIMLFSRD